MFEFYLFCVVWTAIWRYPLAYLTQFLINIRLRDMDDFTVFSFRAKPEFGMCHEEGMYFSHNRRVLIASWIGFPLLGPFYLAVQAYIWLAILAPLTSQFFTYNKYVKIAMQRCPEKFNTILKD